MTRFVAIPCAIRDAPDAGLRPDRDDRVVLDTTLHRIVKCNVRPLLPGSRCGLVSLGASLVAASASDAPRGDAEVAGHQPTRRPPAGPVGRIVGRILDASTGRDVSEVGAQIVGTTLGAMSGIEGRYAVQNIAAGTVTVQVRRIGYAPKTVTGILLAAGQTLEQNIAHAAGHRAAADGADDRRGRARQR